MKTTNQSKSKNKSKGLGDRIENFTKATGIDKAVKFVFGEDCGCYERKQRANILFPGNKANCLTEEEYLYLDTLVKAKVRVLSAQHQAVLLPMFNRVFNTRIQPTGCPDCWRDIYIKLTKIHKLYES